MEQQNRLQEKENKLVNLKDASDWGTRCGSGTTLVQAHE